MRPTPPVSPAQANLDAVLSSLSAGEAIGFLAASLESLYSADPARPHEVTLVRMPDGGLCMRTAPAPDIPPQVDGPPEWYSIFG